MQIVNPRRKKQIREFVDENRETMHEFYELTGVPFDKKRILKYHYSETKSKNQN